MSSDFSPKGTVNNFGFPGNGKPFILAVSPGTRADQSPGFFMFLGLFGFFNVMRVREKCFNDEQDVSMV